MAIPVTFATRFRMRGNLRGRPGSAGGTSVVVTKAIFRMRPESPLRPREWSLLGEDQVDGDRVVHRRHSRLVPGHAEVRPVDAAFMFNVEVNRSASRRACET